ncbi:hypothetical protein CALVIDRAFT_525688 [Calocera viscosa TUFC12733]|uniref:Homeobox domain-containing protein n=1 Tax=Calocera viscosa (strain TUFC12733) TaxID=1330018 RepID=A0A167PX10_CALVF|nr:hypothetical protein CALVIDRAFT_525688 [Calocera viscosa TUFC12733]
MPSLQLLTALAPASSSPSPTPTPTPTTPYPSSTASDMHPSELYHDPRSRSPTPDSRSPSSPSSHSISPYPNYSHSRSPYPDHSPYPSPYPELDADADPEDPSEFGFSQPDDIKRRRRTTPEELAVLESEYGRCTLPDAKNRVRIGGLTNMSARSVQIWFQNKRQTDKRKAQGLTRRPPRRVPVSSAPTSLQPAPTDADDLRRRRKTLEQAALAAQRRGPGPAEPIEMNAALAIARMHSAPFHPHQPHPQGQQRRPLGQLNPNTLHPPPQMMRYTSAQQLPASFRSSIRAEPPALVRAYSLPNQGINLPHAAHPQPQPQQQEKQQQRDDPLWTRMLSSPSSSPYVAPFMRKRSLDSVPTLASNGMHSAPFPAAKRQRLSPAPHALEEEEGSDDEPLSASGTDHTDRTEGTESVASLDAESADHEHEHEQEQEPELSFDGSVSSQSSELLTPDTSITLDLLSPSMGSSLDLGRKLKDAKAHGAMAVLEKKMVGKTLVKEEDLPRDWEKEAAELLCFMASGKGEGRV